MSSNSQDLSQVVNNKNYRAVDKDGIETFLCNICGKEAKTVRTVKQHITKHHITKSKTPEAGQGSVVDDDEDDLFPEQEDLFERYGANEDVSLDESTEDVTEDEVPEDEAAVVQPTMELEQALERIKLLEEDVGIKEDIIKNLEAELITTKEMASTAKGVADSFEEENEKNKALAKKFKIVSKKQMIEINQFNAGANPEMAYKLKEAQDELKAKSKALETSEKSRKELIKKVEEEVSARAKA